MAPDDLEQQIAALHPASFAWALACTRWNAADAEEVLQSVYLSVLEGRARFDGRSTFKTWLFSVVRNMAARARRRRWLEARAPWRTLRRRRGPTRVPSTRSPPRSEGRASAARSASCRPASVRCSILVFFHEMTVEQAAQVMGVALGTARAHYHRGKLRLLELLGPEDLR